MKKMFTQISSAQAIKKAASLTSRKRVSHEGYEDSFRVGDSHLRFFERDNQDIMLSFGRELDGLRIHREPEHELPGMKKGFVLEHLDKDNETVKGGDTNGLDMSHNGTGIQYSVCNPYVWKGKETETVLKNCNFVANQSLFSGNKNGDITTSQHATSYCCCKHINFQIFF